MPRVRGYVSQWLAQKVRAAGAQPSKIWWHRYVSTRSDAREEGRCKGDEAVKDMEGVVHARGG